MGYKDRDVVGNLKAWIPHSGAFMVRRLGGEINGGDVLLGGTRARKSTRHQLKRPMKPSCDKYTGASTVKKSVRSTSCHGAILARRTYTLLVTPPSKTNITPPGSISVAAPADPRSFRVKHRERSCVLGLGFVHAAKPKPPASIPTRTSLPTPSIKIKATTVRTEARGRIWPGGWRKEGG